MFFSGCSESAYSGHHLVFCNRQSVEGGGITAIIPFTMRGSSKAKCSVQDAGRTNRLAQRERSVFLCIRPKEEWLLRSVYLTQQT